MSELLTDQNLNEVIESNETVMVDVWATWCGPCKVIGPKVDELHTELPNHYIGKLNVDDGKDTIAKYGIKSIPTFLFFKNGELVEKVVGGTTKDKLKETLEDL